MIAGTKPTTIRRRAAGKRVEFGAWQPGAESVVVVDMAIQPVGGYELQRLPEGDRIGVTLKGYTKDDVRVGDERNQTVPDLVTYIDIDGDAELYAVTSIEAHTFCIAHKKIFLKRLGTHKPTAFSFGFSAGFQ